MLENIGNKITEKKKELSDIVTKIHKLESEIITSDNKIQEKEKDIIGYENGVIPINIASLKGSVGEFMGGWQTYTNGSFNTNEALVKSNDAIKVQNNWQNNKIQNLNSDN